MKLSMKNEKMAKSQIGEFDTHESSGSTKRMNFQHSVNFQMENLALRMAITPPSEGQGGGRGGSILGKAPPGYSRSPVDARGHPPENKGDPPRSVPLSSGREEAGVSFPYNHNLLQTEKEELINKYQHSNFYKHLIFKIMKKQILFLMVFVLAAFASVNKSYGQATQGSAPQPLSCTDDALHPIAGKSYPYTVAATPSGGQYTWWATKNGTFYDAGGSYAANLAGRLTAPTDLTQVDAPYGVPSASATVNIAWSSAILSGTSYQGAAAPKTPTFVAVYYTPPAGSGCADNFKVFELDPKNGFTVDILNLDPVLKTPVGTGQAVYTFNASECFANVNSAKYNTGKMDYTYGVNVMYFEVVAANFSGSWKPTFQLTGLQLTQTAVIEWDYTTAFAAPVTVTSGVQSATAATTNATDTHLGVSIYVRVTVTNHSFEGLADTPITLAVDGTDASGNLDVVNSTCIAPATADFVDVATQTLLKRPTVIEGTTSTIPTNVGIIPKNP